jgi:hypothetical protein
LPRALHRYFWYHGAHALDEPTLLASDGNPYVDELKAGLGLRALGQRMEPARLDALLAEQLHALAGTSGAPAEALRDALRAAAPPGTAPSVEELFAAVVHYDNRLLQAQTRGPADTRGRQRIRLRFDSARIQPRGSSAAATALDVASTTSRAPSGFPLEIGIELRGRGGTRQQVQTVQVREGRQEIEIEVDADADAEPESVRLDPRGLLLDPELEDNALRVERAATEGG